MTEPAAQQQESIPPVREAPVPQQYIAKSTPQDQIVKTKFERVKEFWVECKRVLRATKKPTSDEFKSIMKVAGLGMLIMGVIGFLISVIRQLFF